ncbi:sterile alpha motif domain-containing protein 3-like isoform X2 [Fundulus heteroclitus]|nr:sterile alpha motif domain-containing protein 3-like isoform X2 [Fundulus heteroclitus]
MTSSLSFCRDNLGAHSIGGFVESFSATHCCRFCLGERSQFQILQCLIKPLLGSFFRTMTFTNLTYPMASLRLSQDTVILSSPEHGIQRSQRWPTEFPVPRFGYDTELVLASGNEAFKKDGIPLNFTSVLSDILERLAESIFQYVAYPTSAHFSDVAEALIQKHPCLKEPGSYNGCYGWQQRLKYKMGTYRTRLRAELDVNSLRKKRPHEKAPAKNVKRPKKSEVTYLPPHPQEETEDSLEHERVELLNEVKKRDNCQIISEKMAKTFSIHRQEVVNQEPPVSDLKKRWPALFDATQINQEFRRITTVSLETTFLAKLDQYSPKIMYLLSSRGGTAKMKIQNMLVQDNSVETRREAAIRGLMVYLKEKEEQLFKEEDGDGDSTDQLMKIVTARGGSDPAHAKIVIEGTEVLTDVDLFPEPVPCSWG